MKDLKIYYYQQTFCLFEMLKCMKNREVAFIDKVQRGYAIRGMNIKSLDYLKNDFFRFCSFEKKNYNIYISCAKYNNIPNFSFSLKIRSSQTGKWFKDVALDEIYAYDLLLDFDCKDEVYRNEYKRQIQQFFSILSMEKVKFYCIPSGNNFQFVIPSKIYGFDKRIENKTFIRPLLLATKLKRKFRLKFLDLKGIGYYNKLMKCPYSIAGDNVVCIPISNCFFNDVNDFKIDKVLNGCKIKDRGLYYINNDSTAKEFNDFLKKYKVIKEDE